MKTTVAILAGAFAAVDPSLALVVCGSESKSNREAMVGLYPGAH